MNKLVFDIQRFAIIDNSTSNTIITGTSEDDSIYNKADFVTINGGAGNDTIRFKSDYILIESGEGNDYVSNGMFKYDLFGSDYSTINTGDGNDFISGYGYHYSQINTGNGNDVIGDDDLHMYNSTITTGDGEDVIFLTFGRYNLINSGAENDEIYVYGYDCTLNGGTGNDTFDCNTGHLINGESGNDSINIWYSSQYASTSTISGGIGDDRISLDDNGGENLIQYVEGDGNDTIFGIKYKDTIQIAASSYVTSKTSASSSDLIIIVSNGSILVKGGVDVAFNIETILSGGSTDTNTGGGNDTPPADEDTLPAGWKYANTAKTSITATLATASNIDLTEDYGADVIKVDASKVTGGVKIFGNEHNNSIKGGKGNDTISGGSGDDTVSLGAGADIFIYAGGNDLIQDYATVDSIQIDTANIEINGVETVGSNIIYSTSEGDITVKSGKGKQIKLVDATGNDIIFDDGEDELYIEGTAKADTLDNGEDNATINALAGNDKITNSGSNVTINAGDGNDYIYNDGSYFVKEGNKFINIAGAYSTINGGLGADTIYNGSQRVTIQGGAGNDSIVSKAGEVIISGEDGDDFIGGYYHNSSISSGAGNDTISLVSGGNEYVGTINAGTGNDLIYSTKNTTHHRLYQYAQGDGNDVIYGFDSNDTISLGGGYYTRETVGSNVIVSMVSGGAMTLSGAKDETINIVGGTLSIPAIFTNGNDTYNNQTADTILNALAGNDYVINNATRVTIIGGDGNDTLVNGQNYVSISGGTGDDSVINIGNNSTVYGDAGNDYLFSSSLTSYGIMDGGDDNDYIMNNANNITLKGGAGNDSIVLSGDSDGSYGKNVSVDAGTGDDLIWLSSNPQNITVKGGKGNDIIINNTSDSSSNIFQYAEGDGNDAISNLSKNDTLHITSGTVSSSVSGADVTLTVGKGKITLQDYAEKSFYLKIGNAAAVETIISNEPDDTILGTDKADNLSNADDEKTIIAMKGNDIIDNTGNLVSISGDAGNDNISNTGDDVTIDGGAGRDKIFNEGHYTTIIGGQGDDTIENYGENILYQYAQGDGKDTIIGFGETDTLEITKGAYSYSISNNDFLVKVSSGTITLKDAADKIIHINDETIIPALLPDGWKYGTSSKTNTNAAIITATVKGAENIDLSESYGDGVETVDGSKTSGIEIIGNDLDNSIKGGNGRNILDGGDGNDTLVGTGGVVDTFIYSGGDDRIINYVGGSNQDSIQLNFDNITYKNGKDKIERSFDGEDVIYTFTNSPGFILVQNAKEEKITLMDSNGKRIILVDPPKGWKLDFDKGILQATMSSAENEIDLAEDYGEDIEKVDGSKISGGVEIYGNNLNNSLQGGKGNDILDGGSGNDILISGAGDDTLIYSGGDDIITDYTANHDVIQIDTQEIELQDVATVGSNVIYYTSAGNLTVKNGNGKDISLVDQNGAPITIPGGEFPTGWKFDSTKNLLQATIASAENEIDLNKSYGENVTKVDGSKIGGGVEIIANDNNNSIKTGKGNDLITGGSGNDTVSLGAGADTYFYTGGDDLIQDYATVDAIQFDTSNIEYKSKQTVSSNVIIYTSEGNITLKGGKGKTVNLIDENGEEIKIAEDTLPAGITVKTSVVTAASTFKGNKISLADYPTASKVNASAISQAVSIIGTAAANSIKGGKGADKIYGGAGNDTIFGGAGNDSLFGEEGNDKLYGEAGNDTLSGGKGNDTLTGGAGNDVFVYSGGKDVITDYTAGQDKIKIASGTISKTTYSGQNVIFTIGTGSLTVQKNKGKNITIIDSSNKTTTQTYSRTADLFYDNNFISDENNLDSITEQKFSVTQIQTDDKNFAQDSILVYSAEK